MAPTYQEFASGLSGDRPKSRAARLRGVAVDCILNSSVITADAGARVLRSSCSLGAVSLIGSQVRQRTVRVLRS